MTNVLAAALAALLAAPTLAQTIEEEAARTSRDAAPATREEEVAAEAKALRPLEGAGQVSYEDVLKTPDDVELNYRWAKRQVEKGDLKGAAATLERILMVKPSLTKVRLTYGVILFRLDSLPEARRELELVKKQASGAVKAEAVEFIARVEAKERVLHVRGTLGIGYAWDTNRNAGPASDQRLFRGSPLNLTTGRAVDDTSMLFLAQAGLRRDLRAFPGSGLTADLSYYRAEQTRLNTLDLQAYSFAGGVEVKRGKNTVSPALLFDHVRLSEESYLRTRGVRLKLTRRVSKLVTVNTEFKTMFNDQIRTSGIPTAQERTGGEAGMKGGLALTLSPTRRLTLDAGYSQRDARKMYNAYERYSFGASHSWLVGGGRFLLAALNVDVDHYMAPDLAIAGWDRADEKSRATLTFGQPLGFLGRFGAPLLLTATYEYLHANSNVTNYAYSNNKVLGMLTYRWTY